MKGHTKNVCDRIFNILKLDWRKQNVFTIEKAREVLSVSENVDVVLENCLFYNYDEYFDQFYKNPLVGSVLINHCFCFCLEENVSFHRRVVMKTKVNNEKTTFGKQWMVNTDQYKTLASRLEAFITEIPVQLEAPGLTPEKVVHMYTKWRVVIP